MKYTDREKARLYNLVADGIALEHMSFKEEMSNEDSWFLVNDLDEVLRCRLVIRVKKQIIYGLYDRHGCFYGAGDYAIMFSKMLNMKKYNKESKPYKLVKFVSERPMSSFTDSGEIA